MTNKKSTKRALLSSVLALFLCFAMLLGTTYAWFTDSVASGSNVIQTGNLDIEVDYTLDGETWNALDGANDLFQKGLWEPGHTEVVALRVSNKGTLALKYTANMNITEELVGKNKQGDDIVLSDILTVSTLIQQANAIGDVSVLLAYMNETASGLWSTATTATFKNANVLGEERELLAGEAHYVLIKVDMAETIGNEANHNGVDIPSIEFGINVVASQYTYENDSFGNQYDADAVTPIVVKDRDEAQAALNTLGSNVVLQLAPGVDYGTLEVCAQVELDGKTLVPAEANTEKVDYYTAKYTNEFSRKFENVTIVGAPGATVDAIRFVNGTFKVDGASGGTAYRYVEVKNFVVDSVEFTDKSELTPDGGSRYGTLLFDLSGVSVDGLTVKNCTLNGNRSNLNFIYAYIGSPQNNFNFPTTMKNVVVSDNTVSGIARVCELRDAENVTISGNVATDLTAEFVQMGHNAKFVDQYYAGDLIITDNVAENVRSNYVRIAYAGNAQIVIQNNIGTNVCAGALDSAFDVTEVADGNVPVIENNTLN